MRSAKSPRGLILTHEVTDCTVLGITVPISCNQAFITFDDERRTLERRPPVELVWLALVARGAVFGHVVQLQGQGDGVVAELESGHAGGDRLIEGVQPLQVRVEVAGGPTSQSDVVALHGRAGMDGDFLRLI